MPLAIGREVMPGARTWFGSSREAPESRPGKSVCPDRLVGRSQYPLRCGIRHCDPPPLEGEYRMKTSHDRASTGRGFSLQEDAQGPPRFRETPTRSFKTPLIQEAPVGLRPTHGGFAGPCSGGRGPCPPLAGFRVRVCACSDVWPTGALDRLLGSGNNPFHHPGKDGVRKIAGQSHHRKMHSCDSLLFLLKEGPIL